MSKTVLANNTLGSDITFPHDGTWQTVDLTSYLNHTDPKAVIIHVENAPGGNRWCGVRKVGSTISDTRAQRRLLASGRGQWPVVLDASNQIEMFAGAASGANLTFHVHAEFGGPQFVALANEQSHVQGLGNQWVTRDNTGPYGSDAGKVVADLLYIVWNNAGDWGYRAVGSTNNLHPNNGSQSATYGIVGVNADDQFQIWPSKSGGKSPVFQVWFYSVGYFLGDWEYILNPVNQNLSTLSAWTDDDITNVTSPSAEIALIRFGNSYNSGPGFQGWLREDGGSEPAKLFIPEQWVHFLVNLDDTQVYEYWIQNLVMDAWVFGHFGPRSADLILDTHKLIIDSGKLVVG